MNVSRTGKNLFSGQNITTNSYIDRNGDVANLADWNMSDYIPVSANTAYTFTPNSTSGWSAYNAFYDSNKNLLGVLSTSNFTFTTPNNCKFVRLSFRSSSYDIQFEHGDAATSYEPYTGNTYQITFGQTVYIGELDVLTGILTLTHGIVDLGTLTWEEVTVFGGSSRAILIGNSGLTSIPYYCDKLKVVTSGLELLENCIYPYNNGNYIYTKNEPSTLSGISLVYGLAKPTTIQLTPTVINTLIGDNVIFADVGDITECKYTRK